MPQSYLYASRLVSTLIKKKIIDPEAKIDIEAEAQLLFHAAMERAFSKGNELDNGCSFETFFEDR